VKQGNKITGKLPDILRVIWYIIWQPAILPTRS